MTGNIRMILTHGRVTAGLNTTLSRLYAESINTKIYTRMVSTDPIKNNNKTITTINNNNIVMGPTSITQYPHCILEKLFVCSIFKAIYVAIYTV